MVRWICGATAVAMAFGAFSASLAAEPLAASPQRMAGVMSTLSADAMEGRKPGTAGDRKTVAFLTDAFARAGLSPGYRGGWLQPVALTARAPHTGVLTVRAGERLRFSDEAILLGARPRERIRRAPVVYAGYATASPLLRGAVVLFHDANPPGGPRLQATDSRARRAALAAAGAAAILQIQPDADLHALRPGGEEVIEDATGGEVAVHGRIGASAAQRLLRSAGVELADLQQRATSPSFRPVSVAATADIDARTRIRRFVSHNVVGRIAGAGRPDQSVLFLAHWDGFGVCRPTGQDRICNAAVDNASGIAGLLEVTHLFAAGAPPERSVVFVATTAEERGLLGAYAYVAAPAAPLADTVAAFNIDTIAIYGRGHPVAFAGANLTTADQMVLDLAALQGRPVSTQGLEPFLRSSDAWPLLRAGVPTYLLSGAISRAGPDQGAAFQTYLRTRYHQPADDMQATIPLEGAAEDMELVYQVGLALSWADMPVDFLATSPFQRAPAQNGPSAP